MMRGNDKKQGGKKMKNTTKATIAIALIAAMIMITGCGQAKLETTADIREDAPYSEELQKRIVAEQSAEKPGEERPDYLPKEMFARLPEFPKDFYQVRSLVRIGRITDFGNLEDKYWMQPEFFPYFEEIGLPLLQNPPKDRWGAYGIAVYPGDSVASIAPGESLDFYFFIKSNYIVETYQGVNLVPMFPEKASIETGYEFPDGTKDVKQDPAKAEKYLKVTVEPNPFILEPNFPIYNYNGTRKVRFTVTASSDTPPGKYVIGLDTGNVPDEYEQRWLKEYLNMYTSGGMTKIDRPYYRAFISVAGGETK
jgi:hypothetical protein